MSRYSTETLVPLSKIAKKFSYTQDHLAYLCRRGMVSAKRKGRKWLSSEAAVINYQKSLEIAGKPVSVENQGKLLDARAEKTSLSTSNSLVGLFGKINLKIYKLADTFAFSLESIFFRYHNVLTHHAQLRAIVPNVAYSGLHLGLPPANLPIGELPKSLANKPFYSEAFVTAPIGFIALFTLFSLNPGLATSTVQTTDAFLVDTGSRVVLQIENFGEKYAFSINSENNEINPLVAGINTVGDNWNRVMDLEQNSSVTSAIEEIHKITRGTLRVIRRGFEILELTAANFFAIIDT